MRKKKDIENKGNELQTEERGNSKRKRLYTARG